MLFLAGLLAAAVGAVDVLRPAYHLTREQYEMNDPNGLMALPRRGSTFPAHDYHMFFQSTNPGQTGGSEWGCVLLAYMPSVLLLLYATLKGKNPLFLPPPDKHRYVSLVRELLGSLLPRHRHDVHSNARTHTGMPFRKTWSAGGG